jgi:hypothetical protein
MTLLRSAAWLLLFLTAGCGGIAKGVTEALLEQTEKEDTRACHIDGPASDGLETYLRQQEADRNAGVSDRALKVLMVHGIGHHAPGYSGRLTENLMGALGLDVRQEDSKDISLRNPEIWDGPLGYLRVSRYMNKQRSRELIFFELTWSGITEKEKEAIAFDDATEYTFRRTPLNAFMKKFVNSHIPDPLIYLGEAHKPILASVQQSVCWMSVGDWDAIPASSDEVCNLFDPRRAHELEIDDFVFVTHSLGSRIVIDMAQEVGDWSKQQTDPELVKLHEVLKSQRLPVYMLANQLPLLELGRAPQSVRGQIDAHCKPGGALAEERMLQQMPIYAFSDPNDILSYPVPPKFADDYMDSRLCPRITNITLNVAKPISLFGLSEVANPLEAHVGYDDDERVIAFIAHGIGHQDQSQIIEERCTWLETTAQ